MKVFKIYMQPLPSFISSAGVKERIGTAIKWQVKSVNCVSIHGGNANILTLWRVYLTM